MTKGKEKKRVTKRARSEFLWGWLFILPTMAGLMILNIIPIIQTIWQSFFKTGAFGRGNIFIGFENYQRLFADENLAGIDQYIQICDRGSSIFHRDRACHRGSVKFKDERTFCVTERSIFCRWK